MLRERITNLMPGGLPARPEVTLRPDSRVVIQRASLNENHAGPMFGTQEKMTAAGFAESPLFAGR